MHPAFASIEFGPFAASYHREAVDEEFKEALSKYLETELLPQVNEPYESTSGRLMACYDNEKYCGPRSAVRDIYKLEFTFQRSNGNDTIKVELVFEQTTRCFRTRDRSALYLWTTARQKRFQEEHQRIRDVCKRLEKRELTSAACPSCSAPLRIVDLPDLFDVSCSEGCFKYNFHRDPVSGEFFHGHFFHNPSE